MSGSELRLIVLVGPPHVQPERLVDACRAAVAGGATAIQVRCKNLAADRLLRHTEDVLRAVRVPVFVNDRADIAAAAGAYGVHVGQEDLPVEAVRRAFGRDLCVGMSVGTPREAKVALATDADYWSVGSVFATATKPDAGVPIGVEGFSRLRAMSPRSTPVVGIGGVTADNVAALLAAGAAGVAVSAAISGADDITAAAAAVRRVIDASRER